MFPNDPPQFDKELLIGSGAYGKVFNVDVVSLPGFLLVSKEIDSISRSKTINDLQIKSERRILNALNGNPLFPFCVGYIQPNIILSQKIGFGCTLAQADFSHLDSFNVSKQIIQAINTLHKKFGILHNDLHASNIIIDYATNRSVVIDFGKATPIAYPITYFLSTTQKHQYNKRHRHLAHELRNEYGAMQSVATDTYSVGYLLKRLGHYSSPKNNLLYTIGQKLKCIDICSRITLDAGLKELTNTSN